MRKIVAIGGGDIGRPGHPVETAKIDREIIRLADKTRPRLLFIPTASSDSALYSEIVQKHFGKRLGCKVDVLYLLREKPSKKEIEKKVFSSDIIYVGGGNTLKMMNRWRETGLDKIIRRAYERGIVLSGVSAGAICWFKSGNSDSRKFKNPKAGYIKVSGLNLVNLLCCPHYDTEKDRKADLKKMMSKTPGIAIALDNCCAIEIVDGKFRIICSKNSANAYKIFWSRGKYHKETIEKAKELRPLKQLLAKSI